jgi:hypothetical protein
LFSVQILKLLILQKFKKTEILFWIQNSRGFINTTLKIDNIFERTAKFTIRGLFN